MYVYVWIYISDSFVKSCHVVSTRSRKENACFLSRRNIHNFTCAICLSDFWNAAVKTCRPRDSFSKQQKKVPRCYSTVWTSEYQIHATVYLTTNSNQLKIDKKINAKNCILQNLSLPFKSILLATNIFLYTYEALITNFSHYLLNENTP